ncbi:putative nuclease HARBI1 [Sardina pilchardus]|uniref:putative nuclease HARBI1 n=1 Tax=Sardina pilchardus TaxID=27697 RepID=UPI002E15101B
MRLIALLRKNDRQCSGWGLELDVLVFLFWLASATSYRVVSRVFAMPRTTIHNIIHRISGNILRLKERIISLPHAMDLDTIGDGFAQLARSPTFSKVVGAIDGCQVRIKPPSQNQACYLNRTFSVQLQAVCNNKGLFLDICVGYPGSVRDAWVNRNSSIFADKLYPPPPGLPYPWGRWVSLHAIITPYREPVVREADRHFNQHHTKARSIIERAFGILKTRWRTIFLKALEVRPTFAPVVIACCVILHNIAMDLEDLPLGEVVMVRDDNQDKPHHQQLDPSGEEVRRQLAAAVIGPIQAVAPEGHDYV